MSSERQPERGASLERQTLAAACRRRGWRLLELVEDAGLAAHERNRPGVKQALRVLESGEANALVATKRERFSDALGDLAALLASAQQQGWALVALDCATQTTPAAEARASLLATFAHSERRSISERTRAALALARAQGVRLGRPPQMSKHAIERIRRERAPAAAWPRSRTDSTPIASPPPRAVAAGIQPPSATRSTEPADPWPSQFAGSATRARQAEMAPFSSRTPGRANSRSGQTSYRT